MSVQVFGHPSRQTAGSSMAAAAGSFPPPHYYRTPLGDALNETRFIDSLSTSTADTETTRSTVRTVNFQEPLMLESATQHAQAGTPMSQSFQMDQVVVNEVIVRHPRSLLVLACIELICAVQLAVLGMICRFYDGCPLFGAICVGLLLAGNALVGVCFVKLLPKRALLVAHTAGCVAALVLSVALFVWTAVLLDREDAHLRRDGFDFRNEHLFKLNQIVENTKIAMYTLHLVLLPIHALCCVCSLFLLYVNFKNSEDGRVSKAFYFSDAPMGHQKVLVPIEVRQVKKMPQAQAQDTEVAPRTHSKSIQTVN